MGPQFLLTKSPGLLRHDCRRHSGLIVYVTDDQVELVDLHGNLESLARDSIDTVYVFNVIENPIEKFKLNERALKRLKAIYLEDSKDARTLALPVRYIEDLIIF